MTAKQRGTGEQQKRRRTLRSFAGEFRVLELG
jgi:hypothetical protein